jgi:hypothetical protein
MKLKSDRSGFLVGESLGSDKAEKLLTGIRGDTRNILALMRSTAGEARAPTAAARPYSTGAAAARTSPLLAAVAPAGRGGRVLTRGEGGLVSAEPAAVPNKRLADLAEATKSMAKTSAAERRDRKLDKNKPDGGPKGNGRGGALLRKSGSAALDAAVASQQVDPLLESVGEAANVVKRLGSVAVPLGRAAGGLRGLASRLQRMRLPPGVKPDKNGRLRDAKGRYLKDGDLARLRAAQSPVIAPPAGEGGGLLPGLIGGAGGAAGLGIARWLTGRLGVGMASLGVGAKALLKRAPVVGSLIEAITGVINDQRIANDKSLTDQQRDNLRVENALGTGGGIGGAALGGAIGTAIGTAILPGLGSAIGGALGAIVGALFGRETGQRLATNVNDPAKRWDAVRDKIVSASKSAGVDPGLVAQISTAESGNDPNARPLDRNGVPMSSAHGLGQLLDGTWANMVRAHGEKYGIPGASQMTDAQAAAFRSDPAMQANMLAELTAENVKLGRGLGGTDDAANVYALHNLGAGSGSNFLKALRANPGGSVTSVLSPTEIANNPSLYKSGTVTLAQAYENMSAAMTVGTRNATDARRLGSMPTVNPPPVLSAPGPMPTVDVDMPTKLNSPAPIVVVVPTPPATQDVADRGVAHIVTGGIGRGSAYRW